MQQPELNLNNLKSCPSSTKFIRPNALNRSPTKNVNFDIETFEAKAVSQIPYFKQPKKNIFRTEKTPPPTDKNPV
jgi:hypothetical protein